jgi:hypothetical protein
MESTSHFNHNIHNAQLVIRPSSHPPINLSTINQSNFIQTHDRQALKLLVYKYVCHLVHELHSTNRTATLFKINLGLRDEEYFVPAETKLV